jgi:hypothetical protein
MTSQTDDVTNILKYQTQVKTHPLRTDFKNICAKYIEEFAFLLKILLVLQNFDHKIGYMLRKTPIFSPKIGKNRPLT